VATQTIIRADALDFWRSFPEGHFDLAFGSPPYCDARTYGIGAVYDCLGWVEWMLDVSEAAARACKGPVFWVAAGVTRDRCYWPAVEGLCWEWWKRGGRHQLYRPYAWVKRNEDGDGSGIPGSGGDEYHRADWEYVVCLKRPGKLPWADNTALGRPPRVEAVGGEMSNRHADGVRQNERVGRGVKSRRDRWANGEAPSGPTRRDNGAYKKVRRMDPVGAKGADGEQRVTAGRPFPKLANPGNVVYARVGGGHMGHPLCHEGEAPFPERLAEFFVLSFCPPGGRVGDCFSGSGTTAAVCKRHHRDFAGCDIRQSQVDLGLRRLAEETPLMPFMISQPEEAAS